MPSFRDKFPSRFLKPLDLTGRRQPATIERSDDQDVGYPPESKPVLFFQQFPKPLILNKTICEAIEEITGTDDIDGWKNAEVTLVITKTRTPQGKSVEVVRVEPPEEKQQQKEPLPF